MKTLIYDFLNEFATKVGKNEQSSYVDLMMDDHTSIEFEGQQYYVPENNSFYTQDDELLLEMINATFGV